MKTSRKNSFSGLHFPASVLPCAAFTLAFTALIASNPARAAALTWDTTPDDGAAVTAGSGAWSTAAVNWNNSGTNVAWSQTNTSTATNSAIFAGDDAAANTYVITLDAQMATSGLTFNSTGYMLDGTSGLYLTATSIIETANGKAVTIACPLIGSNAVNNWLARQDSTVHITGITTNTQQPLLVGEAGAGTTGTFNFSGTHTFSVPIVNAPVNVTGGTFTASTSFMIGRGGRPAVNGVTSSTGTFTLDGADTILNHNGGGTGNNTMIGRDGGTGMLVIKNGTFNTATSSNTHDLALPQDNNGNSRGTFDVRGGTVNIGSTTNNTAKINLGRVGLAANQVASMTQSGGTIHCHGGILFGGTAAGNYSGTAIWTMTGGTVYLGTGGISEGTLSPIEAITLSGGTVGALANWTGALPMTLGTINGDVTFQCADSETSPFDITLTKPLTGEGGLKKTGGGKLTLSDGNTYSGTTLVSNGTLRIVTGAIPSNIGPVTLDGSAGSPIVSVQVTNAGQSWEIGTLTCAGGTPAMELQYGALPPGTTTAPLNVTGDMILTVIPQVLVGGTAIAVGTYPLIQYTGSFSGTAPTTVTLPGYCSGTLRHDTGTRTISLVVSSSTYNPALSWAVGDGVWDINTSVNWTKSGVPAKYSNGNAVTLDDTSTGDSPITITLDTAVTPYGVTANATKDYLITGAGSIAGTGSINLLGAGALTLSGLNTYSGGTILNAGQLNIDNGGNAASTAIGTGPLTINAGTALDNTSGSDVTLLAGIPETWNGSFSYLGSANSLHTGAGPVTLGNNIAVNVVASTFTVGGSISGGFKLTKTGAGTLALPAANTFSGGMTLSAGGLNVANPASIGTGILTLEGGTIDNVSNGDLTLSPASILLGSTFTFAGSGNLTIVGPATLQTPNTPSAITVTANTLTLTGTVTLANTVVTKRGLGTLTYSGDSSNSGGMIIHEGRVNLDKSAGNVITNSNGVTVNATGSLVITGAGGDQIADSTALVTPVRLAGGTFDLNGHSEKVDNLTISGGGTLRNGAEASVSSLTLKTGGVITLADSGGFEAAAADGFLNLPDPIVGNGALHKTGAGTLTLGGANTYSGPTTVEVGTLEITGSLGASTVTVSGAANLSGNGNIGGDVTIQSGAHHALAVAASAAAQVTRVITGTLTLDSGNILDLTAAATPSGGTYVLATATTITGTPTAINYGGPGTVSVDTVSSPNRLLLTVVGGSNYASWANDPSKGNIPGEPASGDFDHDGISNLVEYALGMNPRVSSQPAGVLTGNVITYPKGADAIANGDVSWVIETSATLAAGSWIPQVTQAAGNPDSTIFLALTPGSPAVKFARLKVTQAP